MSVKRRVTVPEGSRATHGVLTRWQERGSLGTQSHAESMALPRRLRVQLTPEEGASLKSQTVTSNARRDGARRAAMNVEIIRALVRPRGVSSRERAGSRDRPTAVRIGA